MKTVPFLAILLLPFTSPAQRLVVNDTDLATGKLVKETEWIKMRCRNGNTLHLKARKVNDDIRIYYRSRLHGKGEDAACQDVDVTLYFEGQGSLDLPSEKMRSVNHAGWKFDTGEQENTKWEEPQAIATKALSLEQIAAIEKNRLKTFQICFFNKPMRLELKEKDQALLSSSIKAVM